MKTLKHLDFPRGNKIIMDVCWRALRGNSSPYLSVDVKTVKLNHVLIHGWQEQKEAVRLINKDFYILLDNHLINKTSPDIIVATNIDSYWTTIQKARDDIFKRPITKEEYREQIEELLTGYKDKLKKLKVFRKVFSGITIDSSDQWAVLKTIINNLDSLPRVISLNPYSGYYYRYLLEKDLEKPCLLWEKELLFSDTVGLNDFICKLKNLIKLEKDAPASKTLYTKQKLASKFNVSLDIVNALLVAENKDLLGRLLAPEIENNYNSLVILTEELNIPTVTE